MRDFDLLRLNYIVEKMGISDHETIRSSLADVEKFAALIETESGLQTEYAQEMVEQ